jgi:hypothetical protein
MTCFTPRRQIHYYFSTAVRCSVPGVASSLSIKFKFSNTFSNNYLLLGVTRVRVVENTTHACCWYCPNFSVRGPSTINPPIVLLLCTGTWSHHMSHGICSLHAAIYASICRWGLLYMSILWTPRRLSSTSRCILVRWSTASMSDTWPLHWSVYRCPRL